MGIYDRNYYRGEEAGGSFFSMNNGVNTRSIVIVLIAINAVLFVLDAFSPRANAPVLVELQKLEQSVVQEINQLQRTGQRDAAEQLVTELDDLRSKIAIVKKSTTGSLSNFLALNESDAGKPWYWFRILTAAFAHASTSHIFGNMLVLFFFGRPIESMYGSKRFLWMYLTAALAGNLIWLLVELISGQPGNSSVLGASGATTAVFLLFCLHFPHQTIYLILFPFFGIPAWIMGIVFVGGDIIGQLGLKTSNVAFLVHLVGAAYAYMFFRTRWTLAEMLPAALVSGKGFSNPLKSKPKLKVHDPGEGQDSKLAEQADKILKKLHERGESSLSGRERRILEQYSRSIKQRK